MVMNCLEMVAIIIILNRIGIALLKVYLSIPYAKDVIKIVYIVQLNLIVIYAMMDIMSIMVNVYNVNRNVKLADFFPLFVFHVQIYHKIQ